MQPCDTCGDSHIMKNKSINAARQEAEKKHNETKEPYCVCEEAGEYFATSFKVAIENRFNIREMVHRLPDTA